MACCCNEHLKAKTASAALPIDQLCGRLLAAKENSQSSEQGQECHNILYTVTHTVTSRYTHPCHWCLCDWMQVG